MIWPDLKLSGGYSIFLGFLENQFAYLFLHELAFEAHRWFDLLRTEKAIEVMNAYGVRMKAKFSNLVDRTYNVTGERLVYPIPYRETQLDDAIEQNPGY